MIYLGHDQQWRRQANCRGMPADIFYPPADQGKNPWRHAQSICHGDPELGIPVCPVMAECLADSLKTGELKYGYRAGMTPTERRLIAYHGTRHQRLALIPKGEPQ